MELRVSTAQQSGRGTLSLRVAVHNRSDSVVGLYALLRLDPNAAYIQVQQDVLHIEKGIVRPPPMLHVPETVVPFMVQVARGGSYREELTYPIPVVSSHPVRVMTLRRGREIREAVADSPVEVREVLYTLEAFFVDASVRLVPMASRPGAYRVDMPPRQTEHLSARAALDIPITALDYRLVTPPWAR
jgi:hypothetical protein